LFANSVFVRFGGVLVVHSTDRARYVKIGGELSREFSGVQILQRAVR